MFEENQRKQPVLTTLQEHFLYLRFGVFQFELLSSGFQPIQILSRPHGHRLRLLQASFAF